MRNRFRNLSQFGRAALTAVLALLAAALEHNVSLAVDIDELRVWNGPERTRVVFDLTQSIHYKVFELDNPSRVVVDIDNTSFNGKVPIAAVLGPIVETIRYANRENSVRFVVDLKSQASPKHFTLAPNQLYGHRLVLDLYATDKLKKKDPPKATAKKRTKKEFLVVIDPGHGGEDPGAVGAKKTLEKKLVLQISKRLSKLLNNEPGIKAVLTRNGDYYIPLRKRTKFAIDHDADLFVSIHADAFTKRSASGISVFALSDKGATSERARVIANKENSSDLLGGEHLSDKPDDVVGVLAHLAQTEQIERSVDLGRLIRMQLGQVGKLHGHDVEQAGFVVLKTPNIPSLLVEVGFISNLREEQKLRTNQYQDKLARGIKHAVIQYMNKYPWRQDEWRTASN